MIPIAKLEQAFIDGYDKKNYTLWNTDADEMTRLRKTYRDYFLEKQEFRCCYCQQKKYEKHGLTWDIEHIAPKSRYPEFLFEQKNLTIACKECNTAKGEKDTLSIKPRRTYPSTGDKFKIIHAHYDNYSDHIEIITIGNQTTYRVKNGKKGKETYLMCNLIRFDYAYAEWENFDDALNQSLVDCLDLVDQNMEVHELKKVLPLLVKAVKT